MEVPVMMNKDLLSKSITDMTAAEKTEAAILAKNLLDMMLKKMTAKEKEAVLNSYGTYEIPARLK
jgi:nucleoid DNA-binding protein